MRIELDAVTNEYVIETLESVESEGPQNLRQRAVTMVLKTLLETGMISHSYNPAKKIDEFRATKGLTELWERDFPELEDVVQPTETIIVNIGMESRTFSECLMIEAGN